MPSFTDAAHGSSAVPSPIQAPTRREDMTDRRVVYRILGPAPLGEGGFARVHRAQDRQTGDVVALKVPRREPAARDRLRREIQVQTAFVHPNVMPVVEHDSDTYRWFTMPLGIGNLYSLRPSWSTYFGASPMGWPPLIRPAMYIAISLHPT